MFLEGGERRHPSNRTESRLMKKKNSLVDRERPAWGRRVGDQLLQCCCFCANRIDFCSSAI